MWRHQIADIKEIYLLKPTSFRWRHLLWVYARVCCMGQWEAAFAVVLPIYMTLIEPLPWLFSWTSLNKLLNDVSGHWFESKPWDAAVWMSIMKHSCNLVHSRPQKERLLDGWKPVRIYILPLSHYTRALEGQKIRSGVTLYDKVQRKFPLNLRGNRRSALNM